MTSTGLGINDAYSCGGTAVGVRMSRFWCWGGVVQIDIASPGPVQERDLTVDAGNLVGDPGSRGRRGLCRIRHLYSVF